MKAGDNIHAKVSSWKFSGETSSSFDKHIEKSVPGYLFGQTLVTTYSDYFINLTPKIIYDLGCSTGSLLAKIESRHSEKEIKYYGLDIIPEMIDSARKRKYINPNRFNFECKDITNIDFKQSSIIISYYTLQFILPSVRQDLVNKIYESLAWGGAFFVFGKPCSMQGFKI